MNKQIWNVVYGMAAALFRPQFYVYALPLPSTMTEEFRSICGVKMTIPY